MRYRMFCALIACAVFAGVAQASHIVFKDGSSLDGLAVNPDATNQPLMVQVCCGSPGYMLRIVDRHLIDVNASQLVAGEADAAIKAQKDGAILAANQAAVRPPQAPPVVDGPSQSALRMGTDLIAAYQYEMARIGEFYQWAGCDLADLSRCPCAREHLALQRRLEEQMAKMEFKARAIELGFDSDDLHTVFYDLNIN